MTPSQRKLLKSLKEGDHVLLRKFEGDPQQEAVIEEIEDQKKYPGMMIVTVDSFNEDDDGLREVHIEQVKRKL